MKRFGVWNRVLVVGLFGGACAGAAESERSTPYDRVTSELAAVVDELPTETPVTQAVAESGPLCDAMCTARTWIDEERYDEAREALARRLVEAPKDVEAVLLLNATDLRDEEYARAYERANAWVTETEDVRVLEQRARASLGADDPETAAEDFRDLISALGDLPKEQSICNALSGCCHSAAGAQAHAWVGLATAEYNRQDLDRAEEIASRVLSEGPVAEALDPAYGKFVKALIASRRGDDLTAESMYRDILARHPNEPGSLINLGGVHFRRGDLQASRRFQEAAFAVAGVDRRTAAIAWANVAEIDMLAGDFRAAEEKLLETLSISKSFAAGHFGLGVLYDLMGRTEESAEHMREALRLDTNGVTRWNTSWLTPEWEQHFRALEALAEGRLEDAEVALRGLTRSSVPMLRDAALRHVAPRS